MRNKEGGGAPKGACRPLSAPHIQTSPLEYARARKRALSEARSPSGASPRHSPRLLPLGSAPGRASWNYRVRTGGPSPAPVQRAPRGPVVVPAGTMPGAGPGADWQFRPRGPLPLHPSGMPSGKASQVSEIRWMYSKRGRVSRARHDRGDTISPLPAWGKGRPSSYPCRPAGPARISAQNTLYFEPGA
jgi:hypothetical protein